MARHHPRQCSHERSGNENDSPYGHTRSCKNSGTSGACSKSKLSSKSFARVSQSVSASKFHRVSTNLSREENSVPSTPLKYAGVVRIRALSLIVQVSE